ncbi:MAG: hypothetical protein KGL53_10435, partial [Elusimicrobia bacterium]|nr:hypothetical protein [Elusimicrobiota bacterium]
AGDAYAAYTGGTVDQELRYARRTGGTWGAPEAVDPGVPAAGPVIAVDPSGAPVVFYGNPQTGQLRLAKRGAAWTTSVVATGSLLPGGLALDATGYPRVTYYDRSARTLSYAAWDGSAWNTSLVDGAADVGRTSSLALDAAGDPAVAYYDATNGDLKFASRTAAGTWVTSVVDGAGVDVGSAPAVAVDADGDATIAYLDVTNERLKVASWTASGWMSQTVDSVSSAAAVGGLALTGSGDAVVTYYDAAGQDLRMAFHSGSSWGAGSMDTYGDVGGSSALALQPGGGVLELHYDATNGDLKAGTWSGAGLPEPLGGNPRGRADAPASFGGVVASSTEIKWTWTDSASGELGWRVYSALSATGPFTLAAGTGTLTAVPGTGTQIVYPQTGLTLGTTYYAYAVAVGSGGFAASPMASLAPYSTADTTPPTVVVNSSPIAVWHRGAGTLYDVDLFDSGGSALSKFEVKASTVAGGAGPDQVPYTDVAVNILADAYTTDWGLPAVFFAGLADGTTNYITLRVTDGAGNATVSTDVFKVLKDTTPPSIVDSQAGDLTRRASAGTLYDVGVVDGVSGLAGFQYSVSTTPTSSDASVVGWTDIPLAGAATSFSTPWSVDFASLIGDVTGYVSVRAWDRAGSTSTKVDAFFVLKDTAGPTVAITLPASPYRSVLTVVSGTASDPAGVGGVEYAFSSGASYWNGAAFAAASPVWFAASGTSSWTAPGLAWADGTAYRVVARATDTLSNYSVSYATADFTFDASTPTAAVVAPAQGASLVSLASLSGTAADPGAAASGLSLVEVALARNKDGLWWNWDAGVWGTIEVSTTASGTTSWSVPVDEALRTGLSNAASYFIAVRAQDAAVPANQGSFAVGSTFTWVDVTPPAAVTDLSGLTGDAPDQVKLSWSAPGDDGSAGTVGLGEYAVAYATFAAASFSTSAAQVQFSTASVVPGAFQGRVLSGLLGGTTYHVRVFMADSDGNWSAVSNDAVAMALPNPNDKIEGHVMKVSSEGITAVLLQAYDGSGTQVSSCYSAADGSGT